MNLFRRPADATFLLGALGAILAGYGAHRLLQRSWHTGMASVRMPALAAAIMLGAGALRRSSWACGSAARRALATPLTMAALCFAGAVLAIGVGDRQIRPSPQLAAAILAAVTAVDLAYNNGPSSSTACRPRCTTCCSPTAANATIAILKSRVVADDTRRDRIELAGLGFHWPNASLTHRLENTLGYNPVRLALYSEATGAEDHVGLPDQRQFSALFPSYRSTLANLLGLRFIATGAPIEQVDAKLEPGDLPLVARTSDGYIYENVGRLPARAVRDRAREAPTSTRLLADGAWPQGDLRSTVLLEQPPAAGTSPRRPGRARIVSYRNTEVVLEADSPDGGWVVLNDLWHPWWFAEVDGQPADMLRANVLFRAVAVPPGRHPVRFRFRPIAGAWTQLRGP